MAWVRFPDGSRRKVERIDKADAQRDLGELLALRASAETPGPRRQRLVTFGEVIDGWTAEGCPTAAPSSRGRHARTKSPNTIANIRYLLDGHVRPDIGKLWVDRTTTERLEAVFRKMGTAGYATSTIHHTWCWKCRRWKAGRQHSWRMVPWNRSHTVLWLGDRAGVRTWVSPLATTGEVNALAMYSGPLSVSTARTDRPMRR